MNSLIRRFSMTLILIILGIAAIIALPSIPSVLRIISISSELANARAKSGAISESISIYKKNVQYLNEIAREMPNYEIPSQEEKNELTLFTTLESFAQDAKLEQTLNLKERTQLIASVSEYPFEIKIRGTYNGFLQYLQKIEALPAIISINSIAISGERLETNPAITATLTGTVRLMQTL